MSEMGDLEALVTYPSAHRLETAALVARRMRNRHYREGFPKSEKGERNVLFADPEDTLREVFGRADAIPTPATICVSIGGGGVFPIIVRDMESDHDHEDHQECAPDTELGMLVELLATTRGSVCVELKHPVQLELASV